MTFDQIKLEDGRFPYKMRSSIESSIWQEIGTDNSVVLQYKLEKVKGIFNLSTIGLLGSSIDSH